MGIFQDIELEWQGRTLRISAKRVMGLLHRIEDVITLKELSEAAATRGTVSLSRLASAYGAALRYAGATLVEDEDVYAALFDSDQGKAAAMQEAIMTLLMMMVPPTATKEAPGKSAPAAAATSKKPSRSRSARGA